MKKFNLDALVEFVNENEQDGRTLAGLERAGLIERKEGRDDFAGAKPTRGAKTLLKAAEELGWV